MLRPTRGASSRRQQRIGREDIQRLGTEDVLKCPLCLDTFETPRALACLHTFCEPCLEFYLTDAKASLRDGKLEKIECPVCKYLTVPPDVLKHPHAMVKDLPLNHFILPHLDTVTPAESNSRTEARQKTKVNFTQSCGSCSDRGVATEAVSYCHDCEDFQCGECVDNHSKIKVLTRHKIAPIEHVTSGSQMSDSFDKHNICLVHQNEDIRFYCANHDAILCSNCVIEGHKACDILSDFEDIGMKLRNDDQTDKLGDNLKSLQKALNDMVEAVRANNYGIKRETEDIPRKIQSIKTKVLRLFQYLEERTEKKIQNFQDEYGKKNTEKAFKCKQLIVAIAGSSASLDTVIEHGSNPQLFLAFQKLKAQLQEYDEMVKAEKESLSCSSIQLNIDDALTTIVTATDQLGEVFIKTSKPDLAELPPLLFARREESVTDMSPEFVKSGSLKITDANVQKNCIAATYMDKKLALLFEVRNRTWFSYTFSLISSDKLEEIYTQDLKRDPKNIVCIDSNNVAITFPNSGFIEFYLYTPKKKKKPLSFLLDHTVKCDIRGSVMSKYNKTTFALSTGNYFATLTHDGVMKRLFYYSVSLRARESDFWSTQLEVEHMSVDFKRKRIYIVSCKPDKLYSLSTKGEVMFDYTFEGSVNCIDLDKEGTVCACAGNGNGRIYQISPNTGTLLRTFTVDTNNPHVICFNRKGGDFYIAENTAKKIKIEKYRFNMEEEDDLFMED